MAATDKLFAGSIPEIYDRFLVPLIFEAYARDLAERVARVEPREVLETAAGTGVLTRAIAARLPAPARMVVTDLNQPMLDHAQRQSHDSRITWRQADALALPFEDQKFDVVACQFGAMFFPDKVQGYREARRVLKPGGRFLFNVWDRISENEFADVVTRRWRRCFRKTRLASWPASRTAITMWKKSARSSWRRDLRRFPPSKSMAKAAPLRRAILRLPTAKELLCGTKSRPAMRRAWKAPRTRRRKPSSVALERGRSKAASGRT